MPDDDLIALANRGAARIGELGTHSLPDCDCYLCAEEIAIRSLAARLTAAAEAEERSYQTLESYGVPRGRARYVANGIEVLAQRMNKESHGLRAALTAAAVREADLRNLLRTAQAFIEDDGDDGAAVIRAIDAASPAAEERAHPQPYGPDGGNDGPGSA